METRQNNYYHKSLNKFKGKGFNIPIYRYIPFERFLHLILNKEMFIPQVIAWEDPYENWLIKASFFVENTRASYKDFLTSYYGQCWTMSRENDAFWRIYSPDKNSIKIKSSIKKLLSAKVKTQDSDPIRIINKYIGQVSYLTSNQIIKWVKQERSKTGIVNSDILRESQFVKRKEFNHEKEIRLIITNTTDPSIVGNNTNHLLLQIEPNDFIDEIIFDPRLLTNEFILRSKVISQLGFKNRIRRSTLYDFKSMTINVVND
jgi:hypothetical protein